MNRQRLTILRDALIEHARNPGNLKFDLDTWARVPMKYSEKGEEAVIGARLGQNFCGTTACAMGLAASLPEFNRLGLRLDFCFGSADVTYKDSWDGLEAAELFFGISKDDSWELFLPESYDNKRERQNPLAVADKITALLEVTA